MLLLFTTGSTFLGYCTAWHFRLYLFGTKLEQLYEFPIIDSDQAVQRGPAMASRSISSSLLPSPPAPAALFTAALIVFHFIKQ